MGMDRPVHFLLRLEHSRPPWRAGSPARGAGRRFVARRWRQLDIATALDSTGPLLIFLLATLLVVGAVALLSLSDTLWMLVIAIAIHAAATVLVLGLAAVLLREH